MQSQFLEGPVALKVLRWPRRAGKTTIMASDDLYFALHDSNVKIIVAMPKLQQIKEIYFQAFHEHLARMDKDA